MSSMSSHQKTISICAFMMLILTSCLSADNTDIPTESTGIPSSPIIDSGLAYGTPCKPPCWQDLIPGKTTHQEALGILEELVINKQINHFTDYSTGVHVFLTNNNSHTVFVSFEGDILSSISGNVNFYYPVKSLIEQFGPPEGLYIIGEGKNSSRHSCEEWLPPEPPPTPMMSRPAHLLYPELGLHFGMLQPAGGIYICPEMEVAYFCYYEPISMSEALQDNYLADLCGTPKPTERELVKWHGFGDGY